MQIAVGMQNVVVQVGLGLVVVAGWAGRAGLAGLDGGIGVVVVDIGVIGGGGVLAVEVGVGVEVAIG